MDIHRFDSSAAICYYNIDMFIPMDHTEKMRSFKYNSLKLFLEVILTICCKHHGGARWPSGLERWLVQATGLSWPGSNPTAENFASELWQFRLPRFASVFRRRH